MFPIPTFITFIFAYICCMLGDVHLSASVLSFCHAPKSRDICLNTLNQRGFRFCYPCTEIQNITD